MAICYECPIMTNELHRYFPYSKDTVESAETQEKPKSEHCSMLTGKNLLA